MVMVVAVVFIGGHCSLFLSLVFSAASQWLIRIIYMVLCFGTSLRYVPHTLEEIKLTKADCHLHL